jgi:ribA/ribD-fused uncharacterized protein
MWEFSNFEVLDEPITFDSILYPTAEHLYQALKTKSIVERQKIAKAATPGEAKRLGRRLKHLNPDWHSIRVAVMAVVLHLKFVPGNKYSVRLAKTKGEIVEWNYWHDTFWGKCTCKTHGGEGKNKLGLLLMGLRGWQKTIHKQNEGKLV